MTNAHIYFDHNATSPCPKQVHEAMLEVMDAPLNPSSLHAAGRKARGILDAARVKVKDLAQVARGYDVVFTASGTESNNLALRGTGLPVITTPIEHASVLKLVGSGIIPVDRDGVVILEQLDNILQQLNQRVLVSVIMANNETGVLQPVAQILDIVKKHDCLLHLDAVQSFGKIPFSFEGAHLITVSGHKFGGPVGAAALIIKKGVNIEPILIGGGQEYRIRSGTQNVSAVHGFGVACELAQDTFDGFKRLGGLRDHLEREIVKIAPNTVVFSQNAARLPNTSSFTMPNVKNETQLIFFDLNGICISAGSACSAGRMDYPHVQIALGYSSDIAINAVRVSLGLNNSKNDVEYFIQKWKELYCQNNKHIA